MTLSEKQINDLKEFSKDELIDYIGQLLTKIETLTQNKDERKVHAI